MEDMTATSRPARFGLQSDITQLQHSTEPPHPFQGQSQVTPLVSAETARMLP
jgi:hypothetical protein